MSSDVGPTVRSAYDRVRAVRRELAAAAVEDQRVWSTDGATFRFDVVSDHPAPVGGYVEISLADGRRLLGQVTSVAPTRRPGPTLSIDDIGLGAGTSATIQVPIRAVAGGGTLLGRLSTDDGVEPHVGAFDAATMRPASTTAIAAVLPSPTGDRQLSFGTLLRDEDVVVSLDAKGFAKHTFVCGQSGSGKTYSIGKLLEQLLLRTTLPIVALDPNSDYVTLTSPRDRAETGLDEHDYDEEVARLAAIAPDVVVVGGDEQPLAVLFGRLSITEQATVLGLDPLADPGEHGALVRAADLAGPDATLDRFLEVAASVEGGDALVERTRNLGVDRWTVWAGEDDRTVGDRLAAGWRVVVIDLGRAGSARERSVLSAAVLDTLWAQRYDRQPRLVLIDEAHNVCPAVTRTASEAAAAGIVRAIAAEGRKFGLYLLLATQEPHKVHPDVLSQCANLLLMRTTSRAALETLSTVFSDVPADLLGLAPTFTLGQGVVAGRISPHPLAFQSGRRLTRDGGTDVPATWATEVPV